MVIGWVSTRRTPHTLNHQYTLTTNTGEIFYGEVQTFATSDAPTGIENVETAGERATVVARYDINGRRISRLQRGLNILIMSNGLKRKVMVR